MTWGKLRRAQLVAPFGVGAITMVPDGTAVITAGLDHWYKPVDGSQASVDEQEYVREEWRLQRALGVSHFRLPPDYRTSQFGVPEQKNLRLTVPTLRFPTWNFCRRCRALSELPLSFGELGRCIHCESETTSRGQRNRRRAPIVSQVQFVAMCEAGHLQDFPWREWVHRSRDPSCNLTMSLYATGGASLGAQLVRCECGASRSLARMTEATSVDGEQRTYLSANLTDDESEYLCQGSMPWHGTTEGSGCGLHLRGSLRAASNLYFSLVRSSIYLPRSTGDVPEKLIEILTNPPMSTVLSTARSIVGEVKPEMLRNSEYSGLLQPYDDNTVRRAIEAIPRPTEPDGSRDDRDEWLLADEEAFRAEEYEVLRRPADTSELKIQIPNFNSYGSTATDFFDNVALVHQLRETRAMWGFSRIYPEGGGLQNRRRMLWASQPPWSQNWLPAYIVRGEGIFLEFSAERLAQWEILPSVTARTSGMQNRFNAARATRQLQDRRISARLVLVHTMAHLLINRLTYECGYSSASLRERLYVSQGAQPMAAMLIYTAAGDSEGSMGGLVRMGKPGFLEGVIDSALGYAKWCSSDPVCMEFGQMGQGPDSCNLAACHGCSLIPETACEEFNRFLDRGLVVGTLENADVGFFTSSLEG